MKHLKQFSGFINEQETKEVPVKDPTKDPMKDPSGVAQGTYDSLKKAAEMIKAAGFGDFLGGDTEGGGATWGERLQGSGAKVPSAEDVKKGVEAVNKAMDRHEITDKNMRASIQGVIGKECGWAPQNE